MAERLYHNKLVGGFGHATPCLLVLFLLANSLEEVQVCLGISYPYLSGLNKTIVSGQLTMSYFDFLGESLGSTHECLRSSPGTNANTAFLEIGSCLESTDFAALEDKWSYNYTSCSFQY